ncbi:cellulase M and related protein [Candidatus Vecturithrix granuli]|uniref:Cellulase M and related protein n=1 Tax=Vecturithrix granuli TaxID=1499967 RepID=A0A081C7J4_VECG1|nr:cellulase M and related protein [Candidatus Vecturithrix granuli]
MMTGIFQCLKELSRLHVVPYYCWMKDAIHVLDMLLEGIPYCITPHGNVFLGETRLEDIIPGKICLQAHLDHPGGILNADRQAQYLFAKYYGTRCKLIGYNLGVYKSGASEKIDQLEVENVVFQEKEQASCLFFRPNQNLYKALSEKTLILHYDALPEIKDGKISNWNLDDLINCALMITLLKKESFSGNMYGMLSVNEEVTQNGIRAFLHDTVDRPLFFVNLDVIDKSLQLKTLDDVPYQHSYGVRVEQSGIKLDRFLIPELAKEVGKDHLAKIPTGHCEAHTMQEANHPFIGIFLKIDHYHNGVAHNKFTVESLSLEELSCYVKFVENTLVGVEKHGIPKHLSMLTVPSIAEPSGTIHIIDHVEAIKNIFARCQSFAEYLHNGIPQLRTIYNNYHITMPAINAECFENVKENILNNAFPEIRLSQIHAWRARILEELSILFRHKFQIWEKSITLINILLANCNARHISHPESILLSLEQIPEDELDRVLIHELTHYLTMDFWSFLNLSPFKQHYYSEGLAVAISQKLLNLSFAEAVNIKEEHLVTYLDNIVELKRWLEDYAVGNLCSYFNGKCHQYFQKKQLVNPFKANGHRYQRYGYVLAALETWELVEKGIYYEHIFC